MKKLSTLAVLFSATFTFSHAFAQDAELSSEPALEESWGDSGGGSDPIGSSNLQFNMKNYGNASTDATISNAANTTIEVGSSGNEVNLEQGGANMELNAESYGNQSTSANISNVSGSAINIHSAGNMIKVK